MISEESYSEAGKPVSKILFLPCDVFNESQEMFISEGILISVWEMLATSIMLDMKKYLQAQY